MDSPPLLSVHTELRDLTHLLNKSNLGRVFKVSFQKLRINGMKKDAYYFVLAIHDKC